MFECLLENIFSFGESVVNLHFYFSIFSVDFIQFILLGHYVNLLCHYVFPILFNQNIVTLVVMRKGVKVCVCNHS